MFLAILIGVIVLVVTLSSVVFLEMYNHTKANKLAKLNRQANAIHMLKNAMNYVETLGPGENNEYHRAKLILEQAMYRVVYE